MSLSLVKSCPICGAPAYAKLWGRRSLSERLSDMSFSGLTIRCWSCQRQIRADNTLAVALAVAGILLFSALYAFGYVPRNAALWMSIIFAGISAFVFVRHVVVEEPEE